MSINNQPKVSICIISYNHAAFLPMTIESALAQTYDDFEIVIVDDGSTDGSLAIAESYAQENPNVRVFTHSGHINKGISATINLTIEKARGEYITTIGSDDAYYPAAIAEEVKFLDDNPQIGLVSGRGQYIDKHGLLLPTIGGYGIDKENIIRSATVIASSTVMVRRKCYEEVGVFNEDFVYGDYDLFLRITLFSRWEMGFLDKILIKYRVHDSNVSGNVPMKISADRTLSVLQNIKRKYIKSESSKSSKTYTDLVEQISINSLDMFCSCAEDGEIIKAVRYLSQYAANDPRKMFSSRRLSSVTYRLINGITKSVFNRF